MSARLVIKDNVPFPTLSPEKRELALRIMPPKYFKKYVLSWEDLEPWGITDSEQELKTMVSELRSQGKVFRVEDLRTGASEKIS